MSGCVVECTQRLRRTLSNPAGKHYTFFLKLYSEFIRFLLLLLLVSSHFNLSVQQLLFQISRLSLLFFFVCFLLCILQNPAFFF